MRKQLNKMVSPIRSVASPLSWWFQARQFLREVKVELKKVTWPNRKETIGSTLVVIVVVLLMSFYFGIIDLIFGSILGKILR